MIGDGIENQDSKLDEAYRVRLAMVLAEMTRTDGWREYQRYLHNLSYEAGRTLRTDTNMKEILRAQAIVKVIDEANEWIDNMIAQAQTPSEPSTTS